ncbi:MAG: DUF5596 domain-containing protein [Oscillospiraceae bacterium]|nr:DUF5596 domain-containing protein [Oscillospiraceae bacterium]
MGTKSVIAFWYKKLNFPARYDAEFYRALEEIEIPADSKLEDYDPKCGDGKRNLLAYLYFCEELKRRYEEKEIGEDILLDTLSDLVVWTDVWSELKGELWLSELYWLNYHLGMRLFKLGRLQFCLGKAKHDVPTHNLAKGDPVVEVHIQAVGPLKQEDCVASVARARDFFATYYPEHAYKCFTCHSWLMDKKLDEVLSPDSNIIRFRDLFDIVHQQPSDAILKYVFKWDTTAERLAETPAVSGFARRVKERRLAGEMFNESFGILKE